KAIKALREIEHVVVLLSMRADFYADLMHSDLWPVDYSQRLEIGPLRGEALRVAICKPSEALGVALDEALVERLLADAADEPGVVAVFQGTRDLLGEKMERRLFSLSPYRSLGDETRSGLAVAIATKAEATLGSLTIEQQAIARRIFLRLVQFGNGRADTRR